MNTNKARNAAGSVLMLGFCLAGAAFGIVGCQNTAEGVKDDAAKNGAAVQGAADNAANATKNAADNAAMATKTAADKMGAAAGNAGEAAGVTPKVKLAITSNSKLNNVNNLINVDTKDGTVYLKGHVQTNDDKKLAGDIAAKTIKDEGRSEKVMNQLTVQSH